MSEEFYPKDKGDEDIEDVDMRPIFEAQCGFRTFVDNRGPGIKLDPETNLYYTGWMHNETFPLFDPRIR